MLLTHLLDEDLAQSTLTKGVVLEVEAIKAVEGLLASMHVQSVHIQIIPAQRNRNKNCTATQILTTVHPFL